MQGKGFGRVVDRALYQCRRKKNALMRAIARSGLQQIVAQSVRNLSKAKIRQQFQRGVIDRIELNFGQGLVGATRLPWRTGVQQRLGPAFRYPFHASGAFGSFYHRVRFHQ